MKRFIDIVLSALLLAVLWPLFAVVALAIVVESGLPVFFAQERIGKGGRPFRILKFRSMVRHAENMGAGLEVVADDPRVTKVGRFLRATSIDELPQLLNVVKGDMSLVGPRPTVRSQTDRYDAFQRRRLEVRPGITGWAQVRGRNDIDWNRRIELDVWYVDHASLLLDFRIMLATVGVLLRREGVYGVDGGTKDLRS